MTININIYSATILFEGDIFALLLVPSHKRLVYCPFYMHQYICIASLTVVCSPDHRIICQKYTSDCSLTTLLLVATVLWCTDSTSAVSRNDMI
jgi:hypothetical protein